METSKYAIRCTTEEQARECEKNKIFHYYDPTNSRPIKRNYTDSWYTIISYDEAISLWLLGEKDYTADEQMEINDMLNEEPQNVDPQKEYPYYKDEHWDIVIPSRDNPVKESPIEDIVEKIMAWFDSNTAYTKLAIHWIIQKILSSK